MGVTIHYRGRLNAPHLIDSLVYELRDICDINNWSYTLIPEDFGRRPSGMPDVRGITFNPHEDSEPVCFLFDTEGVLRSLFDLIFDRDISAKRYSWVSVKTQFAGAETHTKVINLLMHLKKAYFKKFEIHDEGGYYPYKKAEVLNQRMDFISGAIDTIEDVMANGKFTADTPEEFMEQMRDAISKSFGNVEVRVIRLDPNDLSDAMKNQLGLLGSLDDDSLLGEADWRDLDDDDDD